MRTGEGMEKRLFETGDSYHICEDCGAWVPADRYKCDECGGDFSPMAPIYTFSAKDEPKAAEETVSEEPGGAKKAGTKTDEARKEPGRGTEEEFHQGQPVMRCTLCGKRFAFGPGSCPDCGGTAVPELFGERAAKEKAVSPAAERRGDDCAYCYTAYLYDDYGRRSRANHAVKLKEGDNLLGRNSFLLDPRLFFTAAELTQRIRDRYSGISRENVILTVDRDGLTVRYAGEGKAPVRINGNELPEGCSAVLEEGDLLHFGDDDREGCIEVEIGRNRVFAESRMHRTLEAIRQESQKSRQQLGRIEEETANIGRNMEEVLRGQEALQEAMRKITADELRVRESDREEESVWELYETEGSWQIRKRGGESGYTARLGALMPEGETEEVIRRTIRDFLTRRAGGVSEEYYGQVERSLASRQFQLYLYQAAFFEGSCDNILRVAGVEDYAAPLSFLGKAVEEFICTEYVGVIFKSQLEEFKAFLEANGRHMGGYLPQGLLVQYLGRGRLDTETDTGRKQERVRCVVEKAGYSGEDEERVNALKEAADRIGAMTQIRNNAIHAKASESMATPKASARYMKRSSRAVSKVITREAYERQKWEIFSGGALKLMHGYYEAVCLKASGAGKKGRLSGEPHPEERA